MLILAGCAKMPTTKELAVADYGKPVELETCIALVEEQFEFVLPDSAKFEHGKTCEKDRISTISGEVFYGYGLNGLYNARNLYEDHNDYTLYYALIKDEVVLFICEMEWSFPGQPVLTLGPPSSSGLECKNILGMLSILNKQRTD